jgi:hypothetical protein
MSDVLDICRHMLTTCREMDGEEGATAWVGGGESRQSLITFGYALIELPLIIFLLERILTILVVCLQLVHS